ncbi:MAG TPA: cyclic nucleotide-binding domain-containing protein, partial [Longimicrobium sp.]|nr:cyclic nucleotide-binding domain-containing protein [Longimicrobium sp.]
MSDLAAEVPSTVTSRLDHIFPTLTPEQIARVAAHGRTRAVRAGEVLVEAGDAAVPFFVITAGGIEIVRPSPTGEEIVTTHGPGGFTGETNMISGRRSLARARASERRPEIMLVSPVKPPGPWVV